MQPIHAPPVPVPVDASDAVPAEARAVLELFTTELAKVAFPDVDAATLKRQADELRAEAKAVARAQQALDEMSTTLAAHAAALAQTAARALAYARIYADAHPDRTGLATALGALEAATARAPATGAIHLPKRRGRPRRQSAELFAPPPSDP